jgi:hypothetical protein
LRTIPLEMCFKGQRDYLQGADIFNALSKALTGAAAKNASRPFTLAMHNFSHHQCDLLMSGGADGGNRLPMPESRIADFTLGAGSDEAVGWLSESERPVKCRYPFDENEIAQRCILAEKEIVFSGQSAYTPMDILVSISKQLHLTLFPAAKGRWIFTKLQVDYLLLPQDTDGLRVKFLQNFNNRLTKSSLWKCAEPLGYIFFSLMNE